MITIKNRKKHDDKTTSPIFSGGKVAGTKVEYRLFGILLYKKVLYTPMWYGIEHYDYQIFI